LDSTTKPTRKREFLDEMNRVVPWRELVALVLPHAPEGKRGRPPFPVETMLRIHFMLAFVTPERLSRLANFECTGQSG
jgi:transposase, IS5 family